VSSAIRFAAVSGQRLGKHAPPAAETNARKKDVVLNVVRVDIISKELSQLRVKLGSAREAVVAESVKLKNECHDIVEGSVSSEMKEESGHKVRVGYVRAPAILSSLPAPTERRTVTVLFLLCLMVWERKLMLVHLNRLAPYQGAAGDERH
jgi:hypothetical protein